MAHDVTFENVPNLYNDICKTIISSPVHARKEILTRVLLRSKLPNDTLSQIWELVNKNQRELSPDYVYKALALVAWAQQGNLPSPSLFDNISEGLPVPQLGDLSDLVQKNDPTRLGLRYSDLLRIDTIHVDIVPERKGIFLKHVEYQVISKRFGSSVCRRYNDFIALYDLLLNRFPYRLIPKLPPKRVVGNDDAQFVEERRKALRRWLTLIARHPVLSEDQILIYFLTNTCTDLQYKIKSVFRRMPDEFTTSELAAKAKDLVPGETHTEFATSREQLRIILNGVNRIKQIADVISLRTHGYAEDMSELGTQLTYLATESGPTSHWATGGNSLWPDIQKGLGVISKEFNQLSSKANQQATWEEEEVCEELNLLLDVLIGHRDLCERVERGVAQDHQKALARMLALKKRQIQGVLRGTDAESVEVLERRMLTQESVIASVELRTSFSLHCVHLETQLVHAHLDILASVLNSLVSVQARGHSELADVWKLIHPTVLKCLPENITLS
ncbi:sorting nexin-8-like [Lycorma delicatula]|uniref:sorting nexin-8-like n=1 Tax=Lycorma delicatula TaxID=130591 RepID=UPI003F518BC5